MIKKVICKIVFINFIFSQGAWMVSNRTHPELEWETIKTQNFNVHFHNGLYDIAPVSYTHLTLPTTPYV